MTIDQFRLLLIVPILIMALSACSNESIELEAGSKQYHYKMPQPVDDGWQIGHLTDHQIDEKSINQMMNYFFDGTHPGIDSISIVRNNTLLMHENFRSELNQYDNWVGNSKLDHHVMHSTSKSFVSALVGIAFEQGFIADVTTPFYRFFNYTHYKNWDHHKETMTLENVLTMQLGLEWDEWTFPFGDQRNSLTRLTENSTDFVKALLDLPVTNQPGTTYTYNTIASVALGAIVENKTGLPLEDFAQQFLFDPLQINSADWLMTPTGYPNTGSGLFLLTRDMAKFGQLYLDQGYWNGRQIISREWIERSLAKKVTLNWDYTSGYGYQWWLGNFNQSGEEIPFYSTRGHGGQFIIIVPKYDLVVAFTSHNYDNDLYDSPFKIVEQYILPAIIN